MNPVLADWITVVLAPIGVILLVVSMVTRYSSRKTGKPAPASSTVLRGIGIVCVVIVALLQLSN